MYIYICVCVVKLILDKKTKEAIDLPNDFPDSKVYGANMGPSWVLSAPDGPHVGPMILAIRVT